MSRRSLHVVVLWAMLFGLWIVLSGMIDAVHLAMGAVSAALVCALSAGQLYGLTDDGRRQWLTLISWPRMLAYAPWLLWEIVKSNIVVLKLVFSPLSKLEPSVFRIRSRLGSELSRVIYANSITLTPGTVTLDVDADGFYEIHALDRGSAEGLAEGTMERKVAAAVGEVLPA